MSNFTYIPFTSRDYKNENVLSSYALPQTPLIFIPDLLNIGDTRKVLWTFGDGTTSTSVTATKAYSEAGEYTVNLVVYDCFSKAQISTSSKNYHIKNYIDDTFTVDVSANSWKNSHYSDPITITRTVPLNKNLSNVYFELSGSNSQNYSLLTDTFKHLEKSYSFSEKIYNYKIQNYQFQPIDYINFDQSNEIYAKINSNNVVICDKTDEDAFFVGLSASKVCYFKDDSYNDVIIKFTTDNSNNPINNTSIRLSASIVYIDDFDRLSITSNGLDGEFYSISSFNIDPIKFYQTWIPFVIKIKDTSNYTIKRPIDQAFFEILSSLTPPSPLSPSLYTLSTYQTGDGYVYGGVKFLSSNNVIQDVFISATFYVGFDAINGVSTPFSVYPKNYITLEKVNEDFDMTETFKGLRFQETLLDKTVLFDEFIRSIFGDINSSPETLGKKIHEKISNYFTNHYDTDRCEIPALISMIEMTGMDQNTFESSFFKYPEQLKRIVGLASVKNNKLFGESNKFAENLNPRNSVSKEKFGKNLGNQINTNTYTISAGTHIVSYEKFSTKYNLLNTYQPVSATGSNTYKLSGYNDNWGWGLILPTSFTYNDFPKYYEFYEYLEGTEDNIVGNLVTTDSENDFNNKIREVLYESLQLNTQ